MPFKSEKQRRFLWKNHPQIAKRWARKYGSNTARPNAYARLAERMEKNKHA